MSLNILIMFICYSKIKDDYSLGGVVLGTIFSALLALVVVFFVHNLDYRRIENHQFEDDEYYYYGKAVPKMGMTNGRKKANKPSMTQSESKEHTYRTANGVKRTT